MNFLQIIKGTPYWVWILFAYLVISGIKASKPRTLPLWKTSIAPLIFIIWSLASIYKKSQNCNYLIFIWTIALIIGIFFGYQIIKRLKINIDSSKLIHITGSYLPLTLSLIFFCTKYILGVTYAIKPEMLIQLLPIDISISGIISGISAGRFINILQRYSQIK